MSVMRGKFYVFGSRDAVSITHGRDITNACMFAPGECPGENCPHFAVDPENLRTGMREPETVEIPYEVFDVIAARWMQRVLADRPEESIDSIANSITRWEAERWSSLLDEDEEFPRVWEQR